MTRQQRITEVIKTYSAQGYHRTGTDVDRESGHWLAAEIGNIGARPLLQSFGFDRVVVDQASLQVADQTLAGVPLYDCLYTDADGITGTLGPLGSEADIGFAVALRENADQLTDARRRHLHKGLLLITAPHMPEQGVAVINAEDFGSAFGPPVVQLPGKDMATIKAASGSRVKLIADASYAPAEAMNVGCEIEGSNSALAPMVVMTPRSGWYSCASERGGGIACFLELIRHAVEAGTDRTIIFTANSGHELGHTGLDYFLSQQPDLIQQAELWLHLGANFAAARNPAVRLQYSDEEIKARCLNLASGLQPAVETPIGQRPYGEARNIHDGGGRYLSILGGNGLFHHPDDVFPEAVDVIAATRWTELMVRIMSETIQSGS